MLTKTGNSLQNHNSSRKARIGLVCDANMIGRLPFHCLSEKYLYAVAKGSNAIPIILPAQIKASHSDCDSCCVDLDDILEMVDGLLFTGSSSMVQPSIYGKEVELADTKLDPQRDTVSLPLINRAIARGVPLLAICRGFQELNVALGGSLYQQLHLVEGMRDHRAEGRTTIDSVYAKAHDVEIASGTMVQDLAGGASCLSTNSVHWQGVDRLAERLVVEAVCADDGLVEAVRVADAKSFALGFQWHPEWRFWDCDFGTRLFQEFGAAASHYANSRDRSVMA